MSRPSIGSAEGLLAGAGRLDGESGRPSGVGRFERSFGTSLASTPIVSGNATSAALDAIGAEGAAASRKAYVRPGGSDAVLGHELAHVVQQTSRGGSAGGDAEGEADRAAGAALAGRSTSISSAASPNVVQRYPMTSLGETRIRTEPGDTTSVLALLQQGQQVEVDESVPPQNGWVQVTAGAVRGWVRQELFTRGAVTAAPAQAAPAQASPTEAAATPSQETPVAPAPPAPQAAQAVAAPAPETAAAAAPETAASTAPAAPSRARAPSQPTTPSTVRYPDRQAPAGRQSAILRETLSDPNLSAARRGVLTQAAGELGVREALNPNRVPGPGADDTHDATLNQDAEGRIRAYLAGMGLSGRESYCASFVMFAMRRGMPIPTVRGSARVPNLRAQFEAAGSYRAIAQDRPYDPRPAPEGHADFRPSPGDLIFLGPAGREQHVGFVVRADLDGTIHTLEGNTYGGGGETQAGVMEINHSPTQVRPDPVTRVPTRGRSAIAGFGVLE